MSSSSQTPIRPDLTQFVGYRSTPTLSTESSPNVTDPPDRLDANESYVDLPEELKQKLAWSYQHDIFTNRYPDGHHAALKAAIVEYVTETAQKSGANPQTLPFTPQHITLGNGSDELIRSLLIATCVGGSGSVLVADPTFSMYSILAQTLGVPVVHIGRSPDTFEIDLQAAQEAIEVGVRSSEFLLRRRCANGVSPAETLRERSFSCRDAARTEFGIPPIRLLFVVHPNSPTANPLTEAEITWLKQLPENILVAIDEAYFEFSQHTLVAEVLQHPNWLVMRTFSKAFRLAAHRVGYGVANPQLTAVLEQVRLPYNLPSFTQAAALIALQHRHELLGILPELLQEREKLCQALNRFGCFQIFPSAGNFLFVKLQAETEDLAQQQLQQLCESLRQQGTIIRHIGGGLRITVGDAQQNQRLIARLGESLKQLNL